MNDTVHAACRWCYAGVWRVLTDWFRVPSQPPSLPASETGQVQAFKPSESYLQYLKLFFWIACVLVDLALAAIWLGITVANPLVGLILTPVMLVVMIVPDIVAYVAVHLKYDTTWYVLSDRSMRIRRGIWVIHETTITFENIQNVRLTQGPVERYFGFANLVVETAGGGSAAEPGGLAGAHQGVLAGIAAAEQLRDRLMQRVRASRSVGLGDERHEIAATALDSHESERDLRLLAEIRDLTARLRVVCH